MKQYPNFRNLSIMAVVLVAVFLLTCAAALSQVSQSPVAQTPNPQASPVPVQVASSRDRWQARTR